LEAKMTNSGIVRLLFTFLTTSSTVYRRQVELAAEAARINPGVIEREVMELYANLRGVLTAQPDDEAAKGDAKERVANARKLCFRLDYDVSRDEVAHIIDTILNEP
jgi:hypothetical protein